MVKRLVSGYHQNSFRGFWLIVKVGVVMVKRTKQ